MCGAVAIEAGLPTFAVLGNHDYAQEGSEAPALAWVDDTVARALTEVGVRVLHNEAARLARPASEAPGGPELFIVGIGPHYPREDRPHEALASVPYGAPRLVFMHNPQSFNELPAHSAPLAVAAHTHGGQIRLPLDRSTSSAPTATGCM